jgi:hypothetical protein
LKGSGRGRGVVRFVFYHAGITMCHGDEPLIRGIPALLLLHMLREHENTGKTVFFLCELRKSGKAFGGGGNLEARLARLAGRLSMRIPEVALRRRRGLRILESAHRLVLEER